MKFKIFMLLKIYKSYMQKKKVKFYWNYNAAALLIEKQIAVSGILRSIFYFSIFNIILSFIANEWVRERENY
jgi:hypothetical protein